jgi:hypothetical protein
MMLENLLGKYYGLKWFSRKFDDQILSSFG